MHRTCPPCSGSSRPVNAGACSRRAPPSRSGKPTFSARATAATLALIAILSAVQLVGASAAADPISTAASAAAAPAPTNTTPSAAADPASGDDIRDIRGPKAYLPAWLIPAIAGAVLLLALAVFAAWRWTRRRRPARTLQPFEIALQRLEELRPLMNPASVREFSIAISDVVRRYIEEAFKVIATQRTTEEFLRDLLASAHPSLAPHRQLLSEFLNRCDLAKFAGVSFSQQDLESLHQSARSFVLATSKTAVPAEVRLTA